MNRQQLIELMAQAIYASGYGGDVRGFDGEKSFELIMAGDALSAIEDAGYAVVPVEPTDYMFSAAMNASADGYGLTDIYRAMIKAAQEEES